MVQNRGAHGRRHGKGLIYRLSWRANSTGRLRWAGWAKLGREEQVAGARDARHGLRTAHGSGANASSGPRAHVRDAGEGRSRSGAVGQSDHGRPRKGVVRRRTRVGAASQVWRLSGNVQVEGGERVRAVDAGLGRHGAKLLHALGLRDGLHHDGLSSVACGKPARWRVASEAALLRERLERVFGG